MILVSEADMFLSESLRILAERLSQSEINISHNNQLLVISLPTYRILSHLSFFCNIFFFSNIYFVCQSTSLRICLSYILLPKCTFYICPNHHSYLFWINTDFRILIYGLHNLFHIFLFHSHAATCVWIASCAV